MERLQFVPVIWPSHGSDREALACTLSERGPRNGSIIDTGSGMQFKKIYGRLNLVYKEPETNDHVLLIDPWSFHFLESAWASLSATVAPHRIYWYCASQDTVFNFKSLYYHMGAVSDDIYLKGFAGSDLILASRRGDSEMVNPLIHSGACDVPDLLGLTAVYESAMRGNAGILEQLISSRADVDHACIDASTPLIQAVYVARSKADACSISTYCQVVKMLVHAGADFHACDGSGKRPCDYATGAVTAQLSDLAPVVVKSCANGDFKGLCSLLENRANPNARDAWLWSGLHHAAHRGQAKIVHKLLEAGADATLACNRGYTALEWAQWKGHPDAIALLTLVL